MVVILQKMVTKSEPVVKWHVHRNEFFLMVVILQKMVNKSEPVVVLLVVTRKLYQSIRG